MGELLCWLVRGYLYVLIAYVIFSWVPQPPEPLQPVIRVIRAMVEPILRPMRRVIPSVPVGNVSFDLSILVLFFGLQLLILPILCSL
jgi:YggT family protein